MTKYVVFLRGINVGGRIIKMADLKLCFEGLGFEDTATVLQTGNVLFASHENDMSKLKKRIETALSSTFGYPARVQVFTLQELRKIVAACPFDDRDSDYHAYVIFLENDLAKDFAGEKMDVDKSEQIELGDGVVYWRVRKGMTLASQRGKYLTKAKYKEFNANRNMRTLRKLVV